MKYCFITLRSLTIAQKADKLLQNRGISCIVQRSPRRMAEQGCGYGLRVACADIEEALYVLQTNEVGYKRVYLRSGDGKMEALDR